MGAPQQVLLPLLLLSLLAAALGFAPRGLRAPAAAASTTTRAAAAPRPAPSLVEDGVSLRLLTDHASDGAFLHAAIKKWLDDEYIRQGVHEKIGARCEAIYLSSRDAGMVDLGDMLVAMGTQLEQLDFEDAFVNSWDVANKVSDLLMVRMERELCACAGDLTWATATATATTATTAASAAPSPRPRPRPLQETAEALGSEFARYRYLQRFLEHEEPLASIGPVMALSLGFRDRDAADADADADAVVTFGSVGGAGPVQRPELAPLGWEGLSSPPDFAELGLDEDEDEDEDKSQTQTQTQTQTQGFSSLAQTSTSTSKSKSTSKSTSTGSASSARARAQALEQRLSADLPEDGGGVDVAVETLVGGEYYKVLSRLAQAAEASPGPGDGDGVGIGGMGAAAVVAKIPVGPPSKSKSKNNKNGNISQDEDEDEDEDGSASTGTGTRAQQRRAKDAARRLLLAKWLYAYSFLSSDFPPSRRFVPAHLEHRLD